MRRINEGGLCRRSIRSNGANGIDAHVWVTIAYQPGQNSKGIDAERIASGRLGETASDLSSCALTAVKRVSIRRRRLPTVTGALWPRAQER